MEEEWFTRFATTVEQINDDWYDKDAWALLLELLEHGSKNNWLTTSICYSNDSNPQPNYEYTPLHYVAAAGNLYLVKELVEQYGINVNITTDNNKNAPLHVAASTGQLDVVQYLVDKGADPTLTDSIGGSAIHYAAVGCQGEYSRDIIEYLVENGGDLTKLTADGSSVVVLAVLAGNLPVIEYWADILASDSRPEILVLTTEALNRANVRKKQGDVDQLPIISILTESLQEHATK